MPLTSIIDTSNKVPGVYLQVSLGVGTQSAAGAPLAILAIGNKTSAGSKANAAIDPVYSVDDAISFYGQGSELHRMIRNIFRANPTATLFGGVIAESAGVNASLATMIFAGTATAGGAVEVYVCEERVVASFASGDSATVIGNAVRDAINNNPDLPVTATALTGTVTITAKHKGPRGNKIRVRNTITSGSGYTHTPIDAYLASGATSDSPTAVLDASSARRWNILVVPYDDTTNLALVKTQVTTNATPLEGRRGTYVCASADTLANTTTVATTINDARGRMIWHYNSDQPPAEIAASFAGTYASGLSIDRATNFDDAVVKAATPQRVLADQPIASELASALNNGITPIYTLSDAISVAVCRSITMRSRTSGGLPDYSVLDTSKVDVPDAVADQIETDFAAVFSVPRADGTREPFRLAAGVADEMPPPKVATPHTIKDFLYGITKRFDAEDVEGSAGTLGAYLVDVDANAPNIVVQIDSIAAGRANASVPVDIVEGFHQFAVDVRQVG